MPAPVLTFVIIATIFEAVGDAVVCRVTGEVVTSTTEGGFGISDCYREMLAFSLDRSCTEMSMPAHLTT